MVSNKTQRYRVIPDRVALNPSPLQKSRVMQMNLGTHHRDVIVTEEAPSALGSYSQGIVSTAESRLYTSGQIGLDPKTLKLVDGVEAQIRQTFSNISGICAAAGGSLESISKLTVYLVSRDDWSLVNQVMDELFAKPFPARTAVGVAWLPLSAVVEIEAVVDLPGTES